MPQYAYTVINKENQQLNGTINAPDETSARKELNIIGFSILTLTPVSASSAQPLNGATAEETAGQEEDSATAAEQIIKYEFEALDKSGKRIVGTIQAENIYNAYKRLLAEYQFDVQQLFPTGLSEDEIKKARMRGVDELRDRLLEEKMERELLQEKKALDEIEFQKRQAQMKTQVDFVLAKVNEILNTYQDELDPTRKSKIKYFVEKILRIKNSTNLEYIKQSCEELLTYLQKEEIFLNQAQRIREKTKLSVEAKSMMMELEKINNPAGKDIFESLREWRREHIANDAEPTFPDRLIDILITPLIGNMPEDAEIITLRNKLRSNSGQLKEFLVIYFQAPDPEFKRETKTALLRLWQERKNLRQELRQLIRKKTEEKLSQVEFTSIEVLEKEIFSLAGWVLTFYIIYYFVTIYLNSKQIDFIPQTGFNVIFQTTLIKYFFTTLFFFVCFLGIKIEFFRRKPLATPVLATLFLLSSSLIILNF